MIRHSVDVVTELLQAMDSIVTDYGNLVPTPSNLDELVQGTAFFPGGAGVWQGEEPNGKLAELFPERPFMFVGNNWYTLAGFLQEKKRRSEEVKRKAGFWATLRAYLALEGIPETKCFFTNALMRLIPGDGKATGRQEGGGGYFRTQCRQFFDEQVRIVRPRLVVVMGDEAKRSFTITLALPR